MKVKNGLNEVLQQTQKEQGSVNTKIPMSHVQNPRSPLIHIRAGLRETDQASSTPCYISFEKGMSAVSKWYLRLLRSFRNSDIVINPQPTRPKFFAPSYIAYPITNSSL